MRLFVWSSLFISASFPINHPPHSASLKLTVEEEKFPSSFFFILITSVFLDSAAYIRGVNPEIELNRGYHTATISNG
ncbi:hypothetical protein I3760_08G162600 [Carya illinoinensis]|nr:hypothetical protein I3760_08G162600 [Carya illinoinensis]